MNDKELAVELVSSYLKSNPSIERQGHICSIEFHRVIEMLKLTYQTLHNIDE